MSETITVPGFNDITKPIVDAAGAVAYRKSVGIMRTILIALCLVATPITSSGDGRPSMIAIERKLDRIEARQNRIEHKLDRIIELMESKQTNPKKLKLCKEHGKPITTFGWACDDCYYEHDLDMIPAGD